MEVSGLAKGKCADVTMEPWKYQQSNPGVFVGYGSSAEGERVPEESNSAEAETRAESRIPWEPISETSGEDRLATPGEDEVSERTSEENSKRHVSTPERKAL
ncbi:hypothetical protein NDU88_002765 [Pleurodeles waltl]|uniref:Uncharacterized protein n=1 Tax=Pleurodeles waltl TaxID=8319 RepID=A0AAV7WQV1_PLEWA|nr:hypothetical protein NDU88_002765 [Pleurodeles waltl]